MLSRETGDGVVLAASQIESQKCVVRSNFTVRRNAFASGFSRRPLWERSSPHSRCAQIHEARDSESRIVLTRPHGGTEMNGKTENTNRVGHPQARL